MADTHTTNKQAPVVLVIDPDQVSRDFITGVLRLAGCSVYTSGDGLSGIEAAQRLKPDLVICEKDMPGIDGLLTLSVLHGKPELAAVPFIFVVSIADGKDVRACMSAGADDCLLRPLEGIELLRAVESRLRKRAPAVVQNLSVADNAGGDPRDLALLLGLDRSTPGRLLLAKWQMLYAEGQRPHSLYYLISGKVKVYRTHPDGKEYITYIACPGDFIGYAPLLLDGNYQDNARALETAELVGVDKQDLFAAMTADSRIVPCISYMLIRDLRLTEHRLMGLAYDSLRKRVAVSLLNLADRYCDDSDPDPVLGISRENLSQFIGSATESLIRALSDFRQEKLIDIREGKIFLLDREGLRSIGG